MSSAGKMGNHLSRALKNFYKRRGNKIVFFNGMTLNQLALEMWERLDYKEIDPSVISRVLAGKRALTFQQINIFSEILHINPVQKRNLRVSLLKDVANKFGFPEKFFFKV